MKKELEEELEEDSELEEDLEEVEDEEETEESEPEESMVLEEPILDLDFNNLNFDQFTPSVQDPVSSSSVLENIESRIDRPTFVSMGSRPGVSESSSNSGGGRDDTYIPDQSEDNNGPKYLQPGGGETNIERVDMQSVGRDIGVDTSRPQNFFMSSYPNLQSRNVEQTEIQPERIDEQNVGRKNPLEREEVKYEEHKKYEFDPSKQTI